MVYMRDVACSRESGSILRPHPHKRWSLLDPAHEKQNDKDNQNDADDPDAAVTVPVSITAEASTESAKQEDDENDDEDQSERHEGCPPSGIR